MIKRRIFIAISLPKNIKKDFVNLLESFGGLPIRILTPDNWHITLAFLGYLTEQEIGHLDSILDRCLIDKSIFDLKIKNITWGPAGRKPRMIWANLEPADEYKNILDCIEKELLILQRKERIFRQFRPVHKPLKVHITLARFKEEQWPEIEKMGDKLKLQLPEYAAQFSADKVHIMESRLARAGADYQIIKSYELQK